MDMFSDAQIGLAVKAARLAAGWTAKQLAENCQLLPSAMSKIESGKQSLCFSEAAAICVTLGIRTDHLLALATKIKPLANKAENIKDQLRRDLKLLEQRTIKHAVAVHASAVRTALAQS